MKLTTKEATILKFFDGELFRHKLAAMKYENVMAMVIRGFLEVGGNRHSETFRLTKSGRSALKEK